MSFNIPRTFTGGLTACIVALVGCASSPVPNEKIAVARASVQRTEQAGAPQAAPVELASSRDKLSRADKAAADDKGDAAAQLADQANVDAEIADAAAIQQKSHKAAVEFDASMQALRQESMRSTQPSQ